MHFSMYTCIHLLALPHKILLTGWLKQLNCIFSVLEARSPRSKCWKCYFGEVCCRSLSWACRQLPVGCFFTWHIYPWYHSLYFLFLLGHPSDWIRATLTASFKFDYFCKDLVSKHSHILRFWGWRLENMNFVGRLFSP